MLNAIKLSLIESAIMRTISAAKRSRTVVKKETPLYDDHSVAKRQPTVKHKQAI